MKARLSVEAEAKERRRIQDAVALVERVRELGARVGTKETLLAMLVLSLHENKPG